MRPPSRRRGSAFCAMKKGTLTFTAKTSSETSSEASSTEESGAIPALLTSISNRLPPVRPTSSPSRNSNNSSTLDNVLKMVPMGNAESPADSISKVVETARKARKAGRRYLERFADLRGNLPGLLDLDAEYDNSWCRRSGTPSNRYGRWLGSGLPSTPPRTTLLRRPKPLLPSPPAQTPGDPRRQASRVALSPGRPRTHRRMRAGVRLSTFPLHASRPVTHGPRE